MSTGLSGEQSLDASGFEEATLVTGTMPRPATAAPPLARTRLAVAARDHAIDWLRGLVMVLMVLDHARDFWFGLREKPLDLATTTVPLFATRWVTHFCAPTFVLLAGVSAYLYGRKHGSAARTRFLVTRGLLLVVLELTVIRMLWIPDPFYHFTLLQVIWVLGWSMVVLAVLSRAPRAVVVAFGAVMVLGHNALDSVKAESFGAWAPLWNLLHERGTLTLAPGRVVAVSYPLVPWVGVMALGYALGPLFEMESSRRRAWLVRLGVGAVAAFVLLRALDVYGDPKPWSMQSTPLFTALSFINCEKYPPSLAFLLMTLGPALLLLASVPERLRASRFLLVFGQVPLLFYALHLLLLRYSAVPVAWMRHGASAFRAPPSGTAGSPELPLVYAFVAWVLTLMVLYPLCRRYARLKAAKKSRWLSYL